MNVMCTLEYIIQLHILNEIESKDSILGNIINMCGLFSRLVHILEFDQLSSK